MTQLTEKLKSLQCGCDDLAGKTIDKFVRELGCYYLLFTDGTWCHTNREYDVSDLLEKTRMDDADDCPFVKLGLSTTEEIWQHYRDESAERDKRLSERRRKEYEKLKREFE